MQRAARDIGNDRDEPRGRIERGKEDGERGSRGRSGDGFILDVGGAPRKRQGVKRGALPEEATSIS